MKKFLVLLTLGLVLSTGAYAKHKCSCDGCDGKPGYKMQQKGGFVDVAARRFSVAEIAKLPDDTYVTVVGYLTARVGDDEYNFTDGKDNITVEIDDKYWRGQQVTPKDKIIINGRVDKGFTGVSIDAKSVTLVK